MRQTKLGYDCDLRLSERFLPKPSVSLKLHFPKELPSSSCVTPSARLPEQRLRTLLFQSRPGQLARAPWRLALVTIFQFLENLSDTPCGAQAAKQLTPCGVESTGSTLLGCNSKTPASTAQCSRRPYATHPRANRATAPRQDAKSLQRDRAAQRQGSRAHRLELVLPSPWTSVLHFFGK